MALVASASTQVVKLLLLLISILFIISLFQSICHDHPSSPPVDHAIYSVRRFLLGNFFSLILILMPSIEIVELTLEHMHHRGKTLIHQLYRSYFAKIACTGSPFTPSESMN